MQKVGKILNNRYVKQSNDDSTPSRFLASFMNPKEIYVRSTDTKRTCN